MTTMCAATDKYRHASYVDAQEALRRVKRRRKGKREGQGVSVLLLRWVPFNEPEEKP